jgi:hypothetical protein
MSSIFPETATSASPDTDESEKTQVNLDEEVEVENPEGDFNERTAPPPASKCQAIRWSLDEKGVVGSVDRNKKSYLSVYLKGEVVGLDGFEGYTTKYYCNSIVFAGRPTSEVHHFMNSIGKPLGKMKLGEMKEVIEQELTNGPISYAETDWKASYQGTDVDKNNKPKWVDQATRMDQFPLVDDPENPGKKIRSFQLVSKKNGEPLYAQYYIRRILSPQEVARLQGK